MSDKRFDVWIDEGEQWDEHQADRPDCIASGVSRDDAACNAYDHLMTYDRSRMSEPTDLIMREQGSSTFMLVRIAARPVVVSAKLITLAYLMDLADANAAPAEEVGR